MKQKIRYTIVHRIRSKTVDLSPTKRTRGQVVRLDSWLGADSEREEALHIGLWDLSTYITNLQAVIERLNSAQQKFIFWELCAPVPVGLTSSPARLLEWARSRGLEVGSRMDAELRANVLDTDFYEHAEAIRGSESLDYLVGFTPAMIAFEEDGVANWNYISSYEQHNLLVSLCDFPEFARQAGRPLVVLSLYAAIAQLIVMLHDELDFHHDHRGCLFDFNADRASIIDSVRRLRIDEQCLKKIPKSTKESLLAMLKILKDYQ